MQDLMLESIKEIESDVYSPEEIISIYKDSIFAWKNNEVREYLKNYEYGDVKVLKEDKKKIVYENLFMESITPVRKINSINPIDLFRFSNLKVDKKKFEKILDLVPKELFINTGKIMFLTSEKEIEKTLKNYVNSHLSKERFVNNFFGMNVSANNIILINVLSIKNEILEKSRNYGCLNTTLENLKKYKYLYESLSYEFSYELSHELLLTIFHELRHQMQTSLLFLEIFEEVDIEEDAEDFSMMLLEYIESKVDISFASF